MSNRHHGRKSGNSSPSTNGSRCLHVLAKCAAAATATAAALAPAHAVENGAIITPLGIFDFGAGMLPPPSDNGAVGVRIASTRATELRDGQGRRSGITPDLKVDALVLAGLKMTDKEFLGGKYGFGVVIPILDSGLNLTIPTPTGSIFKSGSARDVGDVQIAPVIVQWRPMPNLFVNAGLMVQLPTGSYDSHRTINTGVNHWTIQPSLAATFITQSGLEYSTSTQINFNTRNRTTDYRSGIEWQQDFAIGQHFGEWVVGIGGYHYQQLTDDRAPGLSDGNRSRVNALGPAIGYVSHKKYLPVVFVHAYKEFGARNRAQGTQLALRASWSF